MMFFFSVQICSYYEGFEQRSESGYFGLSNGIYSIEDLKEFGSSQGVCPYFMTRKLLTSATIIVYSYQYMLDPKIAGLVSKDLKKNSKDAIVVFDEAHNIDDVCISSMSVNIDKRVLDQVWQRFCFSLLFFSFFFLFFFFFLFLFSPFFSLLFLPSFLPYSFMVFLWYLSSGWSRTEQDPEQSEGDERDERRAADGRVPEIAGRPRL